ncbi:uncharacterized protein N7529_001800 [Penicillium soppii]|uniref:uncharacterized protein n=1 Tax=Penicillium soppii TaxID=69789 RepID=UPI0025493075|nr:uncharacterized protein N7529_001800 [Penicillium soppii]KAJ5876216.1 hypothetical protein N7529_001800 [Penicillium soppii]
MDWQSAKDDVIEAMTPCYSSERQSGIWLAKANEWIILAYYDDSKQVRSAQIAAARLADEIREDEY